MPTSLEPRLLHIGWAVHSIDKAEKILCALGFSVSESKLFDSSRDINISFMQNANGLEIELIEPKGQNSPISNLLKKNGPTPYHLCFRTDEDEWDDYKDKLVKLGFVEIKKLSPAPALSVKDKADTQVAFLYHKEIGIIEFALNKQ